MDKFNKVKSYFERGLWTVLMVRNAVVKGWINEEQFIEITGEEY